MDDLELKLPNKEDQLFKSCEDWWYDACVGLHEQDWDIYATGYKMAADMIVGNIDASDKNFLVFPIVFLYRQYLELRLKDIIKNGYLLLNKDKQIHYTKKHNISELWNEAINLIKESFPNQSESHLETVDNLIKEFSKVDPGSYCFRYPVDTKGEPFKYDLSHINLRNLYEVIQGIANLIDGASIGISEDLGFKAEIGE